MQQRRLVWWKFAILMLIGAALLCNPIVGKTAIFLIRPSGIDDLFVLGAVAYFAFMWFVLARVGVRIDHFFTKPIDNRKSKNEEEFFYPDTLINLDDIPNDGEIEGVDKLKFYG